jgi:hypothetical protein
MSSYSSHVLECRLMRGTMPGSVNIVISIVATVMKWKSTIHASSWYYTLAVP